VTRSFLHLSIGMFLCGCTVNNFHSTTLTSIDSHSAPEVAVTTYEFHDSAEAELQIPIPATPRNLKISPECGPYVPLPVPKPVKVDFKELEAAGSGKEINAIALRNVRELHQQLYGYASRQNKHYGEYVKRCVIK
jgi:hypothetical protein